MKMQTIENRERLLAMVQMRLEGYSFQEIADRYEVSRQYVQQEIMLLSGGGIRAFGSWIENAIYPNLTKWMINNNINLKRLAEIIGIKSTGTVIVKDRLCGIKQFRMSEIKLLLNETGQTFEYLFAEKAD